MKPLMRLLIEIATATLIVMCIAASSAAFAAGRMGRSADGQLRRLPPATRNTCHALRRHQAAMRRQILCERVWGPVDVGDELRGRHQGCRPWFVGTN